jgi:hypothetical protein
MGGVLFAVPRFLMYTDISAFQALTYVCSSANSPGAIHLKLTLNLERRATCFPVNSTVFIIYFLVAILRQTLSVEFLKPCLACFKGSYF